MKPWKSRTIPRRPRLRPASFNGATAMKPWKSLAVECEHGRRLRFNGATAMKPWKSPLSASGSPEKHCASMGPRR